VLKGEVKSALLNPKKIILTEKIANQYFGKSAIASPQPLDEAWGLPLSKEIG
jgi:hypothetical protein